MMPYSTKAHCNECLGERNHHVLFFHNTSYEEAQMGVVFQTKYELLKCKGCERIMLRVTDWNDSESDESGNPVLDYKHFPAAISRPFPKWFFKMRLIGREEGKAEYSSIFEIFNEIYIGLQNNSIRLATMGIRALLEYIMIYKVGDNGTFKKNLDEFEKQGNISSSQSKILNTVLETGHATIHRSFSPSKEDLETCMDITENLVATIFIHAREAAILSKKIPPRK